MTEEKNREKLTLKELNITILPDEKTFAEAIRLSHKIAERTDVYFTLDPKLRLPHLTLYEAAFPTRNVDAISEQIGKIASASKPIKLKLGPISVIFGEFVFWNTIRSREMSDLHRKIVKNINPLREGNIPEHLQRVRLGENEAEQVRKYGTPLVLEQYRPHITLTRIKNPSDSHLVFELLDHEIPAEFEVDSISIHNLGDHGTVGPKLKEFKLEK